MSLIWAVKAECLKYKKTSFYLIHFLIPLTGAIVMWLYLKGAGWGVEGALIGYLSIVASAFPFMIAVVTEIAIQREEQSSFLLLLSAPSRRNVFLAKYLILNFWGALAAFLSIAAFLALEQVQISVWLFMAIFGALVLQNLLLYLIHMFLSLQFGKSVSIFWGICGTIISMIFLTGLGERIWRFAPQSWGARLCNYLLVLFFTPQGGDMAQKKIMLLELDTFPAYAGTELLVCIGLLCIWFMRWEGRRVYQ